MMKKVEKFLRTTMPFHIGPLKLRNGGMANHELPRVLLFASFYVDLYVRA